ncbi:MAG TPA: hypothetical protein VFG19_00675 [Geobacteraceae bacterium]|nr:hypothetical protein [Geobacteraceae bacterium]
MARNMLVSLLFLFIMLATAAGAEETPSPDMLLRQKDDALSALQKDNAALQEKIRALEGMPRIGREELFLKSRRRLQEIAADVKIQRQSMADFENFVKWMTTNLNGYSKYIEAGSVVAGFAKVLPIPYAGQASVLTKFISQGILSLNAASVSIARYLDTSRQFISRVESLNQSGPDGGSGETADIARFADDRMLKDMDDVRARLASISELSASTLSFLESLNHYVGSTDAYWNKTKSIITGSEAEKKEKSYLSQSIQNLKNGAGRFNARLKIFEDSAKKDEPLVKSLVTYDELIREITAKTSKTGNKS